jgi:hypothetical protein
MWKEWGVTRDEWYEMFHNAIMTDDLFQIGVEIPGAVNGVRQLIGQGHRVRIVTSKKLRYPLSTLKAQKQTLTWLFYQKLLNDVEVAFTTDKQGYEADVVIDDKPTLKWAQRGALNLLFNQPWNQIATFDHIPEIRRVFDWTDVLRLIERETFPVDLVNGLEEGAGGG